MPNWCWNAIEVYGEEVSQFFTSEEFETTTPLQKYLPMSEYHKTMEGYNNGGYEWAHKTWGTKWPEHDIALLHEGKSFDFSFESPWCPPMTGYLAISKMFPNLHFIHSWREDGMNFIGVAIYHNGNILFTQEREGNDLPFTDDYEEYDTEVNEMLDSLLHEARVSLSDLTVD